MKYPKLYFNEQNRKYNKPYKALSIEISSVDPGSLGGVDGEYDKSINEIIRIILEQKKIPSSEEITTIFKDSIGDFSSVSTNEADRIILIIKKEMDKWDDN